MSHTGLTNAPGPGGSADLTGLGTDLRLALRSFGVALTVVASDRGVVLEGVARTFYGKQMAQELARRANFVVTANRIVVDRTRN